MRRAILKNHVSILALYVVAGSGVASVPAFAAASNSNARRI